MDKFRRKAIIFAVLVALGAEYINISVLTTLRHKH
ncbi:Uncharacterised protein [Raoultella ornithinolytica]|nr:Uncharacterised protein [Raoultella ornithinolytica]